VHKRTSVSIGMFLVCGILFFGLELNGTIPDDDVPRYVRYSDIPTKVKLVGRLGTRLGEEVVTIRGKWKQPDNVKEDTFKFVVTMINGKEIPTPVEIPWTNIEPIGPQGSITLESDGSRKWVARYNGTERLPPAFEGDEWGMMGFETGHVVGWPLEIRHIFGPVQPGPFRPGTFITDFSAARVRMLNKPHDESDLEGFPLDHMWIGDSLDQEQGTKPQAEQPVHHQDDP